MTGSSSGEAAGGGWMRRIGPGFVTAAVVLGPGSIVAASRAGADFGHGLVWLLIMSAFFMAVYASMAARIGCVLETSLLETLARRLGRWVAALLGVSAWLVATGFQTGNNLGVSAAMEGLVPGVPGWAWPPLFTGGSIALLYGSKGVYRLLERLMIVLVGIMILAFASSLAWTGIDAGAAARGLVPRVPEGGTATAAALLATTFSIVAAFYQSYLVQEKRWGLREYRTGIRDAWTGIAVLALVTTTIMLCAAEAWGGRGVALRGAGDVARQLEGLFGGGARWIFCLGLAAASFSSFIVNSLIGGGLLADGLGIGRGFDHPKVKAAASVTLLTGMTVTLAAMGYEASRVGSIVVAQAMTLLAAPLCGVVLLVVAGSRSIMGEHRNRPEVNAAALAGMLVVLWMTWQTARALL